MPFVNLSKGTASTMQVTTEEADEIFYKMVQNGWTDRDYDHKGMRICRTYVYEFVCALYKGKCPAKEEWPENFLAIDSSSNLGSVFGDDYKYQHSREQSELSKAPSPYELYPRLGSYGRDDRLCQLKDYEIEFEIEKKGVENVEILRKLLPPSLCYFTGRFSNYAQNDSFSPRFFTFDQKTKVCEFASEVTETKDALVFSALLKVHVCIVEWKLHAYVGSMTIYKKEVSLFDF